MTTHIKTYAAYPAAIDNQKELLVGGTDTPVIEYTQETPNGFMRVDGMYANKSPHIDSHDLAKAFPQNTDVSKWPFEGVVYDTAWTEDK